MNDFNSDLYKAQAKRITQLMEEVSYLRKENDRIRYDYERPGKFYLEMQKTIVESDLLMDEWKRFVMFLKLSEPLPDE